MITRTPLSQPIRGDVGSDGQLIFADAALRRLHHRAGGQEGGALAIPGLAALAALTLRLKMRLSRAVRVADENEDMELWVEAVPEGDIAKLSILSWRALSAGIPTPEGDLREQHFKAIDADSALLFDTSLRLVSAAGDVAMQLERVDFGKAASDILQKITGDVRRTQPILDAMNAKQAFAAVRVSTVDHAEMLISGHPQVMTNGDISGYRCDLHFALLPKVADPAAGSPGVLFGRQLAPVLRQPLGRIIANAETIGSELNGPIRENYALYAKDIANAARHLSALVDDLGDLEAVERPNFATARDNIELGDITRRVAGLLALKAADHSIRIVTPTDDHKVPAVAEFRRVLQILLNLVTNAIRYSPDGTEVFIDIAIEEDFALVMVSDQGAGIDESDYERVFEKFERLGRSGDGGSGLGLYISRRLARAMGGDLTVAKAASGGAKFTLRLPVRQT
ncbi:MAG: HAMP domain-containing sensor histidine kinase [Sphingorhabdus sp.]